MTAKNALPGNCTPDTSILVLVEPVFGLKEFLGKDEAVDNLKKLSVVFESNLGGVYAFHLARETNIEGLLALAGGEVLPDIIGKEDGRPFEKMVRSNKNIKYVLFYGGYIGGCIFKFLEKYMQLFIERGLSPVFLLRYIGTKTPEKKLKNILMVASASLLETGRVKFYISKATIDDLIGWATG